MRNSRAVVGIFLALLLGVGAFFVGMLIGDDPEPTEASGTFLSRVGVVGPDAFSPSFAVEQYNGEVADATGATTSDDPNLYVGRPPTYGGTGKNACDIEGMIEFFSLNPERAREWARTQGISLKELRQFLESLRPVFLKKNVKLTMFGFAAGRAYGYTAIIEAGTAVLIDDKGMPRVRCACGNPLIASAEPEKTTKEENERLVETLVTPDSPVVDSTTTTTIETPTTDTPPTTITTQEACPEPTTPGTGTRVYIDDWAWVYDGEQWVKVGGTETAATVEQIPGFVERQSATQPGGSSGDPCNPCPPASAYKYGDVLTDQYGDYWRYEYNGYYPIETSGNAVYSILDIPGYGDDCVPCPPVSYPDYVSAAWVDANGVRWVARYIPEADGRRWVNEAGDIRTATELRAATPECAPCPPDAALKTGDRIIDDNGKVWTKETTGYRAFDGEAVESMNMIPGYGDDCVPCPPTGGGDYGLTYIDGSGTVWTQTYVPGQGSEWVNAAGERRSSTQLFATNPDCNPCPPNGTVKEGTEVVADDWVWVYEQGRWWQRGTGYSVSSIDDIAGYSDPCDPCPPASVYSLGDYMVDEFGNTISRTTAGYVEPDQITTTDIQQLSGYRDDCVPCIPESYRAVGTTFVDGSGKRWTSTYDTQSLSSVLIVWVSNDGERKSTREINAMNPECNPCPNPAEVVTGSIYVAPNGGVWRYDGSMWVSKEDGDRVSLVRDLPGYTQNCDPCPPTDDYTRDGTGAPAASSVSNLTQGFSTIEQAGAPVVTEPAETDVSTWQRTDGDCTPPCPPDQPEKGTEYTDDSGDTWVFEPGDDVWRSVRTNQTRTTAELPGYTGRCNPCPPVASTFVDNDMRIDSNGQWWRYEGGRWVNQSSGESRTLLSQLPGYTEGGCDLPPCANPTTLQPGDVVIDGNGTRWVVAQNGEERISTSGEVTTLNTPLDGCDPCPPARSYLSDNNEEILTDRDECNPCPETAVFTEMTGPNGEVIEVPVFSESRPCGDPCVPPTNLRSGDVIRVADRLWVYTTFGWRNDENGVTTWAQTVGDIPGWLSLCNQPETTLSRSVSQPTDGGNVIEIAPTSTLAPAPTTTAGSGVVSIATTTTTTPSAPAQPADNGASIDTTTTVAPAATTTTLAPVVTPTTATPVAKNALPVIEQVACTGFVGKSLSFAPTTFMLTLRVTDADGTIKETALLSAGKIYTPKVSGSTYSYTIPIGSNGSTSVLMRATDDKGGTSLFLRSAATAYNSTNCP